MKIYLDVCCLCRPFDDQLIPRIRNESEAVIAILNRCSLDWELIWSSAITYEVAKIIEHDKKHYISTFAAKTNTNILVDLAIKERAAVFMNLGVKALDALHIACAERAGATVLITTDDTLKNIMSPHSDIISIRIVNPAEWYEEVTGMKVKTLHEIHDEGINALRKTLGPVDMVRFIQMFDHGKGDYTKERKQWLSNDLDQICNEILEMQKAAKTDSGSE